MPKYIIDVSNNHVMGQPVVWVPPGQQIDYGQCPHTLWEVTASDGDERIPQALLDTVVIRKMEDKGERG